MPKSVYSFQGSRVHLRLDDEMAAGYNRSMKAWFQAQEDFRRQHGRSVTTEEITSGTFRIRGNEKDVQSYNKVCNFMNDLYDKGLKLSMDDCKSDYLEKLD